MSDLERRLSLVQAIENDFNENSSSGKNVYIKYLPAVFPKYGETKQPLMVPIAKALRHIGISKLYCHQAEAIDLFREGKNVCLVTSTASGKTIAYNIPVFETLLEDPSSHALYLFPMKALANDQIEAFCRFREGDSQLSKITIEKYDGDTPNNLRKLIRRTPPNIIVTNPDMLHIGILSHHGKWASFFDRLKIVVVDEIHEYRGAFGSHFAYILRRLRQICKYYDSEPQFFCCSATSRNPQEHVKNLTGLDFVIVDRDGAGQPQKFIFLCQPVGEEDYTAFAIKLTLYLVHNGLSVLTFAPSRRSAENMLRLARHQSASVMKTISGNVLDDVFDVYRAGLLPDERKRIEQDLKDGRIRGLFSTNALELGIDIGQLDACILTGFPPTIMSTWQRAGRVGRTPEKNAFIFIIASDNAIDQYFLRNPEMFFDKEKELLVAHLNNEFITRNQLACAMVESGDPEQNLDFQIFGTYAKKRYIEYKEGRDKDFIFMQPSPHQFLSIRGISGWPYSIVDGQNEIGELSGGRLYLEAHNGAIYLHGGVKYRVLGTDEKHRRILVRPENSNTYTRARRKVTITIQRVARLKSWRFNECTLNIGCGNILVRDTVYGYTEFEEGTNRRIHTENFLNPLSNSFFTDGCWIEFPSSLRQELRKLCDRVYDSLHAIEHLIAVSFPIVQPCDMFDIASETYNMYQGNGSYIFIYDTAIGGIGLSESAWELMTDCFRHSLKLVSSCDCKSGCPSCIQTPRCSQWNTNLSKDGAQVILEYLPDYLNREPDELWDDRIQTTISQTTTEESEISKIESGPSADTQNKAAIPSEPDIYEPGDSVIHSTFGEGQVITVEPDIVTIQFKQGIKRIQSGFHGLRLEENEVSYRCANCSSVLKGDYKFCPNCGCKVE